MKQIVKTLALTVVLSSCVDQPDELSSLDSEVATAGGTYQIISQDGRCLDVPGFARAAGVALKGHGCKSAGYLGNQQFTLEQVGGGYRLRAFDSQLCLDLPSGSTADGTIVQQSQCHAGQNQIWSLQDQTFGHVQITTALDASKCVHIDAANAVRLARCSTVAASSRTFGFGTTRTHVSLRQAAQCLDLPSFTTANGVSPQLFGCKIFGSTNQEWTLEPTAGGTFRLRSQSSGKCLDLRSAALTDGSIVEQQSCTAGNGQKWTLLPQTASTYKLQNVASGKCADFYAGALRQYVCSPIYPSQLFEVQVGASGVTSMLPANEPMPAPTVAPLVSRVVDLALVPPVVTGQLTHNSFVINWSVTDPRIVEQRVTVWEEVPGVPGGPAPMVFVVPRDQRTFWVADFGGRSLIAGRRYTASVMTISYAGVSRATTTTMAAGVLPSASVQIGVVQTATTTTTTSPTIDHPIAVFDANDNGIVDNAPAVNREFPNGNLYATLSGLRANVIVGFTLLEGGADTFVTAHLFVDPRSGAAQVVGVFYGESLVIPGARLWWGLSSVGDLDVIQGDGAITPNILDGWISAYVTSRGSVRAVEFHYLLAMTPA